MSDQLSKHLAIMCDLTGNLAKAGIWASSLLVVMTLCVASAGLAQSPATDRAREDWRNAMLRTPPPKEKCSTATYPDKQWQEVPCANPTKLPAESSDPFDLPDLFDLIYPFEPSPAPDPETMEREGAIADLLWWGQGGERPAFLGSKVSQVSEVYEVPAQKKTVKRATSGAPVPQNRPRLLSSREVAEMRDCTPKHIYQLCITHQIPHRKFGNSVKFDRDEIEAWLDSHKIA